jgi:Protein of unknown function (DUF2510)
MTTPAPGWLPDPSGRHEYRYWDGGSWTPDVSDGGLTATDPVPGLPSPGDAAPTDATSVMDPTYADAPTAAYGSPAQPGAGYGAPSGGYPTAGYPAGPGTGSGAFPPAKPPRSGPSTGLLVGLGAVALALVVAIVVVLTGGDDGDDDETSTGGSDTTVTTEDDSADTTATTDGGDDDTPLDLGSGDIDFDDPEVRDMIVDVVADQLVSEGMTQEQAECFTNALLDGIGADRLAEISESGDMSSSITPEDMTSMVDAYSDCGLTDIPLGTG